MTSPEMAVTGTGSHRVHMYNCFPRFVLTIVVQNVPLRMTDMATGNDVTPKGGSLGRVRAYATRSCAISALVGPFHRTWHHPWGFPWTIPIKDLGVLSRTSVSCAHTKSEVAQYNFSRTFSNRNV